MSNRIKMRLKCTAITPTATSEAVTLNASGKSGVENATFHDDTEEATAQFQFTVTNKNAFGQFKVGKFYTLELKPVET